MGNKASRTKDEFVAHEIHYHKKRWKLYNKEIEAATAAAASSKTNGGHLKPSKNNPHHTSAIIPSNSAIIKHPAKGPTNGVSSNGKAELNNGVVTNGAIVNGHYHSNGPLSGGRGGTPQVPKGGEDVPDSSPGGGGGGEGGETTSSSTLEPEWYRSGDHVENIVMSGGGSKGYAFIGALKVSFVYNK